MTSPILAPIVPAVANLLTRQGCLEEALPDDAALAAAVDTVAALAKAYTRGRGFGRFPLGDDPFRAANRPNRDIAAVIVTAAARLVSNPRQFTFETESHRGGSRAYRGGFTGWSLAELAALNRYRVRAQ